MNNSASAQNVSLFELGVLAAGITVAVVLYFLWKTALKRHRRPTAEGAISFLSRVSAPLVFLLIALALKLDFFESAFGLGARFYVYVDAAIVFLAVLLAIRLVDGWLLYRHERKRGPFPPPGVLHR